MLKINVLDFKENCIRNVTGFFSIYKKKEWFNDKNVKQIIKDIDDTIAVKDEYLESPVFGGMSPDRLSCGCKAVILMQVYENASSIKKVIHYINIEEFLKSSGHSLVHSSVF